MLRLTINVTVIIFLNVQPKAIGGRGGLLNDLYIVTVIKWFIWHRNVDTVMVLQIAVQNIVVNHVF